MADAADQAVDRRPKRRCARAARALTAKPSEVHYVGYVEDDETPEQIMKKFETLEKVKRAAAERAAASGGGGGTDGEAGADDASAPGDAVTATTAAAPPADDGTLSEAALRELFKKTTSSNLRNALATGEWDWPEDDAFYSDDEGGDDLRGFWSDGEDGGGGGGAPPPPPPPRRGRKPGTGKRSGAGSRAASSKPPLAPQRSHLVSSGAGVAQVIRRRAAKASAADPDALLPFRVPRPLPLSWGRTVAPYVPRTVASEADREALAAASAAEAVVEGGGDGADSTKPPPPSPPAMFVPAPAGDVAALLSARPPTGPLAAGRTWQALLVNCGWEAGSEPGAAAAAGGPCGAVGGHPSGVPAPSAALARFASLPIPALVPSGFVFAWVRKEHIAPITAQMYAWGFYYVETLTWVWVGCDGDVLALPAPVTARAHATLMIYRKGAEEVELRHQRSPDVVFDAVIDGGGPGGPGSTVGVPPEAYAAIETMLPFTGGKRLELWACPPGARRAAGARGGGGGRAGWTHVFAAA